MTNAVSEFKTVFNDTNWSDKFYRFLQVIFHLYPEDKFHHLIKQEADAKSSDEEIYKSVQAKLPGIKPFLSELTYALPALKKQKKELTRQTLQLLGGRKGRGFGTYLGHDLLCRVRAQARHMRQTHHCILVSAEQSC